MPGIFRVRGWKREVSFQQLVEEMVAKDIEYVAQSVHHI